VVRGFWQHEFENYHFRQGADAVVSIQNELGTLLAGPGIYRILAAPEIDLHFRSMVDEGRVSVRPSAKISPLPTKSLS
jgi:hypothetical protein